MFGKKALANHTCALPWPPQYANKGLGGKTWRDRSRGDDMANSAGSESRCMVLAKSVAETRFRLELSPRYLYSGIALLAVNSG